MSVIHSSISRIQTKPYRINSRQNPGILVNQYNCVTWIAKKAVPAVWNKSKCKADRDFPCRPVRVCWISKMYYQSDRKSEYSTTLKVVLNAKKINMQTIRK